MKLTHLAIIAIRGTKGIVPKLANALDVQPSTIYRYLSANSDELTKAAAIAIIKYETGLTEDQILDVEPQMRGAA